MFEKKERPLNPLRNFRILLADADHQLGNVFKEMLVSMGFKHVILTSSGEKALQHLQKESFDFMITDWTLKDLDGLSLIRAVRQEGKALSATMPILMLTGRAERSDVVTARDIGINEYIVKPFSAQSVYNRLERIVESPRCYVVSEQFIGPDRRSKGLPPPGLQDRRVRKIIPKPRPEGESSALPEELPKIWLPDFSLKKKLGKDVTLESLITPEVLQEAQASIDAIAEDSLAWIKEDLSMLSMLAHSLVREDHPEALVSEIANLALGLSSRAGTFGYLGASEVAYMLYLFCHARFKRGNLSHLTVIEKHLEVLTFIFAGNLTGKTEQMDAVIKELRNLAGRY